MPFTRSAISRAAGALFCIASALPPALAQNLVPNPGFEAGNTGFTSGYTYQSDLFPTGTYFVGDNPAAHNPNWTDGTHPHSGRAMMIVNGDQQANVQVWATSGLPVHQETTYYFSFYVASVHPSSPAILSFSVNQQRIGKNFSPTAIVGAWAKDCVPWFSGTATTASIAIVNQNTTYYGNYFALDDISFDTDSPCTDLNLVQRPIRLASAAAPGP
jgi:hypothetical protein